MTIVTDRIRVNSPSSLSLSAVRFSSEILVLLRAMYVCVYHSSCCDVIGGCRAGVTCSKAGCVYVAVAGRLWSCRHVLMSMLRLMTSVIVCSDRCC